MGDLYTTQEVAKILRCSPYVVTHRHIKQGLSYSMDTKKKYLYSEEAVKDYKEWLIKRGV